MSLLSATDLMNYLYCERIIHFVYVLRLPQKTTQKELVGRRKSSAFEDEYKRRHLIPEMPLLRRAYEVYLCSPVLQLHTVADCILYDDKRKFAYPYEVKYGKAPAVLFAGQRFQVLMQALLIEKTSGYSVPKGYVRFLKDDKTIEVDTADKDCVGKAFEYIRLLVEREGWPNPTADKRKCFDCCYNLLCWGDVK